MVIDMSSEWPAFVRDGLTVLIDSPDGANPIIRRYQPREVPADGDCLLHSLLRSHPGAFPATTAAELRDFLSRWISHDPIGHQVARLLFQGVNARDYSSFVDFEKRVQRKGNWCCKMEATLLAFLFSVE